MITPNLGLESIELADNMQTSLLQKMNSNFTKIDEAYKTLVDGLMVKTGKENLQEAIEYYDEMCKKIDEMQEKIVDYEGRILPKLNVTLNGTYSNSIDGYGAGINHNGEIVIWASSSNTSYENIKFISNSIEIGELGKYWGVNPNTSSNIASIPHACTLTNIDLSIRQINIDLEARLADTTYDYINIFVTVTIE